MHAYVRVWALCVWDDGICVGDVLCAVRETLVLLERS